MDQRLRVFSTQFPWLPKSRRRQRTTGARHRIAAVCRLFGMSGGPNEVQATFWLLDAPTSLMQLSETQPDGVGLGTFNPTARRGSIASRWPRTAARRSSPTPTRSARERSSPTSATRPRPSRRSRTRTRSSSTDGCSRTTGCSATCRRCARASATRGDRPGLDRLGAVFTLMTKRIEEHAATSPRDRPGGPKSRPRSRCTR